MGLDVSLIVFPGEVLTGLELVAITQRLELGVGQLIVRQQQLSKVPFSCLAAWEVAEPVAALHISDEELGAAQKQAETVSLADAVQIAFKLMRKSIRELPDLPAPRSSEDDHLLQDLACAVSRARAKALLVGVFDHSGSGAWSHCEAGVVTQTQIAEGETYESDPDAELARFLGQASSSVQQLFARELEQGPCWIIAEGGRVVSPPRPIDEAALREIDAEPLLF